MRYSEAIEWLRNNFWNEEQAYTWTEDSTQMVGNPTWDGTEPLKTVTCSNTCYFNAVPQEVLNAIFDYATSINDGAYDTSKIVIQLAYNRVLSVPTHRTVKRFSSITDPNVTPRYYKERKHSKWVDSQHKVPLYLSCAQEINGRDRDARNTQAAATEALIMSGVHKGEQKDPLPMSQWQGNPESDEDPRTMGWGNSVIANGGGSGGLLAFNILTAFMNALAANATPYTTNTAYASGDIIIAANKYYYVPTAVTAANNTRLSDLNPVLITQKYDTIPMYSTGVTYRVGDYIRPWLGKLNCYRVTEYISAANNTNIAKVKKRNIIKDVMLYDSDTFFESPLSGNLQFYDTSVQLASPSITINFKTKRKLLNYFELTDTDLSDGGSKTFSKIQEIANSVALKTTLNSTSQRSRQKWDIRNTRTEFLFHWSPVLCIYAHKNNFEKTQPGTADVLLATVYGGPRQIDISTTTTLLKNPKPIADPWRHRPALLPMRVVKSSSSTTSFLHDYSYLDSYVNTDQVTPIVYYIDILTSEIKVDLAARVAWVHGHLVVTSSNPFIWLQVGVRNTLQYDHIEFD